MRVLVVLLLLATGAVGGVSVACPFAAADAEIAAVHAGAQEHAHHHGASDAPTSDGEHTPDGCAMAMGCGAAIGATLDAPAAVAAAPVARAVASPVSAPLSAEPHLDPPPPRLLT